MRVIEIDQEECGRLLERNSIGRLACSLRDQPYVVPVWYSYDLREPKYIYVFSTLGKKVEWMRENSKVCLLVDEIGSRSNWQSVVVTGTYLELREPQFRAERQHAIGRLSQYSEWWETPLAERREHTDDLSIQTIFFRVDIQCMTGLHAI